MSIYSGQSPSQLYRSFFRYLRHIPDPHIWSILQLRVRSLLERSRQQDGLQPESLARAQLKAVRARRQAEDQVRKLHMAVGCHPHALRRLLDDCYGRRGSVRWELINNVMKSHSPSLAMIGRLEIPAVLRPLAPLPVPPQNVKPRARTTIPDTARRKAAVRAWTREWTGVQVPLILPSSSAGIRTGWEDTDVVVNLRRLAGLEISPSSQIAPIVNLAPHIRNIFPVKLKPQRIEQYLPPPPRSTRQNPGKWSNPHRLTRRLLRRAYMRLWESLPWIRPLEGGDVWKKCEFAEWDKPSEELSVKKDKKSLRKQSVRKKKHTLGARTDNSWL